MAPRKRISEECSLWSFPATIDVTTGCINGQIAHGEAWMREHLDPVDVQTLRAGGTVIIKGVLHAQAP